MKRKPPIARAAEILGRYGRPFIEQSMGNYVAGYATFPQGVETRAVLGRGSSAHAALDAAEKALASMPRTRRLRLELHANALEETRQAIARHVAGHATFSIHLDRRASVVDARIRELHAQRDELLLELADAERIA